ncbi:hypothetical protein HBA55_17485 [Pseudomaricurvus alkylphenolicus]|jgi:LuxR family maltose regulon positive regulatory protein|uniref:LuxR C-terminal-related transcriptional regulator n=1 Tax=Pseudomaricurvus alkylphenolicus TaxID=1306991 RepID=UPI0014205568|nr:LuxR C-terminal-related transcriptional regulator [Pseudomaricurvus alkylphenolicus]NIB41400.1 hypothetical protein [Pseudomaricurvus alkylphenolicus]
MARAQHRKDILTAKLQPQRIVGSLIPRTDIVRELNNQGKHAKLTLLAAPAGYGKSTLMNQLMESRESYGEIVSWLSLDTNDNNLDTFSNYLLCSYNEAISRRDDLFELSPLELHVNASPKEHLTILFNEITASDRLVTMMLDDFHVITDNKLLDFVGWMLEMMPNNMALIIGGRTIPEIESIHALRAKSSLVEISSSRIRFTLAECKDYILSGRTPQLNELSIELLYQKTEGWIAALQLALLAIREEDDPNQFVREFSGTDRDIVNYLGGCVIASLDDREKNIMLRTSVLERINGELCTLLTDDLEAAAIISEQQKTGSFVFALDRAGHWFRYHHLFRELLTHELKALNPELYPQLCQKSAQWFEDKGHTVEAIDYYLKAKNYRCATRLISRHASAQVQNQGQHEILFSWIRDLPQEYLYGNPAILVCYIWSLTFTHQFSLAEETANQFRQFQRCNAEDLFSREDQKYIDYSLEMLDAVKDVSSGRITEARRKSTNWLEKWRDAPKFERGTVLGALGAACLHTLEFGLCRQAVTEANKEFHLCQSEYGVSWMECIYALVCMRQGYQKEAREVLEKSLQQAITSMGEHSYARAMLSVGLAQVYYDLNEIEQANQLLDKGFLYIEDHGLADTLIAGYTIKARLLERSGKADQAIAVLIDGERFGRKMGINNIEPALAMERGRLLLQRHNIDAAKSLLSNFDFFDEHGEIQNASPYESILIETFIIRLQIAQGQSEKTLEATKKLISKCRANEVNGVLITLLILNAKILCDCDQELRALRSLEQAVEMAAKEDNISVFIDEYQHLESLLPKLIKGHQTLRKTDSRDISEFLNRLSDVAGIEDNGRKDLENTALSENQLFEKLTKREKAILQQLEKGMTNKELAESMFISLPTLKWHLSNIYGKLCVKNRIQAIAFAQKLN